MRKLLAEKAAAGVDVRVLGWVNPVLLMDKVAALPGAHGVWNVTVGNLMSIDALRKESVSGTHPLQHRVCAVTTGHLLGAMHLKLVIAHDGTKPWAFTGGIDFEPNRVAGEMHPTSAETWHDMAVAVDGPAIQAFYDLFRSIWDTQLVAPVASFLINGVTIRAVEPGTSVIAARPPLPTTGPGPHRVQVARTLPQYKFGMITPPFGATPLPFAPNGAFEVKVALRKAISAATEYIYIEDQLFYSQEVMQWLKARLQSHPTVKVILLTGFPDPIDPTDYAPWVEAINSHLLGLGTASPLNPSEMARVGMFVHLKVFVHSKVTLIDDLWLFAGSANCMRRSLYTDFEVSVATLDEDEQLVKQVRVDLWGGLFGKGPGSPRNSLRSLNRALNVWNSTWGSSRPYPLPPAQIRVQALPLPAATPPFNPVSYKFSDPDSREPVDFRSLIP